MKSFRLNKNILHNGKTYAKDSFIKSSDEGFKAIVDAGHCEEIQMEVIVAAVEPVQSEDESVQQEKPARKSGK